MLTPNCQTRTILTALAVTILTAAHPAHAEKWKDDVRGWFIGIDNSMGGDGCYMHSAFEHGGTLRLGFVPSQSQFMLVLGDDDWMSLEEGKFYPIEVQLGNLSPWTGNASVHVWDDGDKSLVLDLPLENDVAANFIDEFKKMTSISVHYESREILRLSLKGTFAATDELLRCQLSMNDKRSGHDSDPFSSSQTDSSDPFK